MSSIRGSSRAICCRRRCTSKTSRSISASSGPNQVADAAAGQRRPGVPLHGAELRRAREGAVQIQAGRVRSRLGRRRRPARGLLQQHPARAVHLPRQGRQQRGRLERDRRQLRDPSRRRTSIRRRWFYAVSLLLRRGRPGRRRPSAARPAACRRASNSSSCVVDQRTRELEGQRTFLRKVIDLNPGFIFAKERSGRFTLANRALAAAYGTTVDELIGRTDARLVHADTSEVETVPRRRSRGASTPGPKSSFRKSRSPTRRAICHWLQVTKIPLVVGRRDRGPDPGRGDGHHAAEAGGDRDAEGQGSGRSGDRGEERVPGQHEPRDPHADERRARA